MNQFKPLSEFESPRSIKTIPDFYKALQEADVPCLLTVWTAICKVLNNCDSKKSLPQTLQNVINLCRKGEGNVAIHDAVQEFIDKTITTISPNSPLPHEDKEQFLGNAINALINQNIDISKISTESQETFSVTINGKEQVVPYGHLFPFIMRFYKKKDINMSPAKARQYLHFRIQGLSEAEALQTLQTEKPEKLKNISFLRENLETIIQVLIDQNIEISKIPTRSQETFSVTINGEEKEVKYRTLFQCVKRHYEEKGITMSPAKARQYLHFRIQGLSEAEALQTLQTEKPEKLKNISFLRENLETIIQVLIDQNIGISEIPTGSKETFSVTINGEEQEVKYRALFSFIKNHYEKKGINSTGKARQYLHFRVQGLSEAEALQTLQTKKPEKLKNFSFLGKNIETIIQVLIDQNIGISEIPTGSEETFSVTINGETKEVKYRALFQCVNRHYKKEGINSTSKARQYLHFRVQGLSEEGASQNVRNINPKK